MLLVTFWARTWEGEEEAVWVLQEVVEEEEEKVRLELLLVLVTLLRLIPFLLLLAFVCLSVLSQKEKGLD